MISEDVGSGEMCCLPMTIVWLKCYIVSKIGPTIYDLPLTCAERLLAGSRPWGPPEFPSVSLNRTIASDQAREKSASTLSGQ